MMIYTMRPRACKPLEFKAPDDGGYVHLDGRQICHGGGFTGSTIICGAGMAELQRAARSWWRQHRRGLEPYEFYGARDD